MKKIARRALSSMRRPGLAAVSIALALGMLATPAAASPSLTISHGWFRFLTPQIPAAGYLTLHNDSEYAAVLTGAAVPDVVVPAHSSVTFRPGGYHLMCMSPLPPVSPGRSVPISLSFKDGSTVTAMFPVYGAKGK